MQQMLVADGAARVDSGNGPAQYGKAMKIYTSIRKASKDASEGVLQRLAVAISLEHAVPRAQRSAKAHTDAPRHVDPVQRYLSYEKAYKDGELDAAFGILDTWNLRFVVDGEEPDEIAAGGARNASEFQARSYCSDNYGLLMHNQRPKRARRSRSTSVCCVVLPWGNHNRL